MKNILSNNQNTFLALESILKNKENEYLMVVDHLQMYSSKEPDSLQMFFRYCILPENIELIAGSSRKNKTVEILTKDSYYSAREGFSGKWEKKEGNIIIPSNRIIITSEFKKHDKILRRPANTTEFYFGDSALNCMYSLFMHRQSSKY